MGERETVRQVLGEGEGEGEEEAEGEGDTIMIMLVQEVANSLVRG